MLGGCSILTYLGMIVAAQILFGVLQFVQTYFLRPAKNLSKMGKWSIVTGSTDGIGMEMAKQLARKGQNIILISRTQSKLDAVAAEIEAESKVQTKTVQIDLTDFSEAKKAEVQALVDSLEVGILVNNAGMSYPHAQYYHETAPGLQDKLIRVNCDSVATLTSICLPKMLDRKTGAVVNVSSGASVVPQSLYAGYAGAKAYVTVMTENLIREYSNKGISFSAHIPLFVVSKMSKIRRSSLTVPSAKAYAKDAVKQIGYDGIISPNMIHGLMLGVMSIVPLFLKEMAIDKMHHDIRKRALRKAAKAKKSG